MKKTEPDFSQWYTGTGQEGIRKIKIDEIPSEQKKTPFLLCRCWRESASIFV